MASTIFNGKLLNEFNFAGVNVDKAFFNGHLVFQKLLSIELPQAVTEINLQAFIEANNPNGLSAFIITNNYIQPRIITGDLDGYDVILINNGEIRGTEANKNALHITSLITVMNYGWIRGAGGDGGAGGKGGDDTYSSSSDETRYVFGCGSGYSWGAHLGSNTVTLVWGSVWGNVVTTGSGPVKHPKVSGDFYRSTYKCQATCDTTANIYAIRRRTYTTKSRTGGAGGAGGHGISFDQGITYGQQGLISSPSGGNTGGAGGSGGNWGIPGVPGAEGVNGAAGVAGEAAGYAIVGTTYLAAGSNTGSLSGDTSIEPTADLNHDSSIAISEYRR